MKRLKEKNLRRQVRKEGAAVIANYGLIRVSDARLRVAKDEHNRRAAQKLEEERVRKKEVRIEADFIRRWLQEVRKVVRASVTAIRVDAIHSQSKHG